MKGYCDNIEQRTVDNADFRRVLYTGKNLQLVLGITNLADRDPPMSLRINGSHQVGYDPRYASAVGRAYYLSASYKF